MNKILSIMVIFCFLVGCQNTPSTPVTRTAEGILAYFPKGHKTVQAFYGHNFMVGDTPVIPTEAVPKEMLLKLVGKKVVVKGVWCPGQEWSQPKGVKGAVPIEATKGPVILGDGIKLKAITQK